MLLLQVGFEHVGTQVSCLRLDFRTLLLQLPTRDKPLLVPLARSVLASTLLRVDGMLLLPQHFHMAHKKRGALPPPAPVVLR